jgi:RHS repeat-associated protein
LSSLTKADNQAYTNDKVSNRTQATISGTTTTYTIATGSNRLDTSKVGTVETKYDYDSAGNMIKAGSSNYVYDGLNRLKSVTLDTAKNGDTLATYQYNAYSQRILKDVDGKQTIFIYNSAGQLLEEYNKAQNTTRDYVYADGMLVAIMENGINVYVITDHLNAPQVLLDSTGRNIWSATYDPFGKATITGNLKLNLRADGQYNDDETGLYYNWYRYYNPSLGRYITSDPMGLQAGMNTYIYVNGNPINYTDPQGLFAPILIGMAVSGGSEIFAQYLQHGGNISNWNMRNIAVATVFGIIPGGASMYSVKMGFGFLKTFAADGLSSGVATLLQSQTINRCEDKQTSFGDDLITFQQGNTYGVLGNATTEFVGYTRYKPLTKTIISNVLIGAQPPLIEKVVGKDGRGISK